MKHQGSKITPGRFPRTLRALHGLAFLYAIAIFCLGAAPVFQEPAFMAYREFWVSFGIALPFIAASGVAFFSLATNSFHGTALCLCFFVLLTVIMLAPGDSPGAFLLYTGLMVFYGVSAVTFFRTVREKWAAHMAMRTFAHKTGFFTHK